MDRDQDATPLSRWRVALQLFALATVVGALAAGQQYFAAGWQGEEAPFVPMFIVTIPYWYVWALFTPVVAWPRAPSKRGESREMDRWRINAMYPLQPQ